MTFTDRHSRLVNLLAQKGSAQEVLLTNPTDIRWLTGLNSSNAVAIVDSSNALLVTDNRYAGQARTLNTDIEVVIASKVREIALERWSQMNGGDGEDMEPVARPEVLQQARAVKDSDELESIRQACQISVEALGNLLDQIRPGLTEVEVARMLELEMAKLGAEDRAFATIVATGPHSAIPHHAPTTREIQQGELLKIDFGARVDGYNADCTRTFVVGTDPEEWHLELHADVLEAADAANGAVREGISGRELDAVARELLTAKGVGELFLHGLGHGVGLDIHEYPFVIPGSADIVGEGSVFTIEPGLYLEGRGGIRVEDTLALVDGELITFTKFDRSLQRVG